MKNQKNENEEVIIMKKSIISFIIAGSVVFSILYIYASTNMVSNDINSVEYINYEDILSNKSQGIDMEEKIKQSILSLENIVDVEIEYTNNTYTVKLTTEGDDLESPNEVQNFITQLFLNIDDNIEKENINIIYQ